MPVLLAHFMNNDCCSVITGHFITFIASQIPEHSLSIKVNDGPTLSATACERVCRGRSCDVVYRNKPCL